MNQEPRSLIPSKECSYHEGQVGASVIIDCIGSGVTGRYLIVQLDKTGGVLTLCEVTITISKSSLIFSVLRQIKHSIVYLKKLKRDRTSIISNKKGNLESR